MSAAAAGASAAVGAVAVADTALQQAMADAALQQAMATGEYEALAASLAAHHASASEPVLAEAREVCDTLRERHKKQKQKQRQKHAGAMEVLAALQSAQRDGDARALEAAVSRAQD